VIDTGLDLPTGRQQQVSSSSSSNQNNSNVSANIEQGIQSNVTVNNNRSESNLSGRKDENAIEIAAFYNAMFGNQGGNMNNLIRQFIQGNGQSMNSGGNMNQSLSWNDRNAQQHQGQGYGHQGFGLGVLQNNFSQDWQQVGNNEQNDPRDWQQEWNAQYYQTYQNRGVTGVDMNMDP
jgi:hypothetical protein